MAAYHAVYDHFTSHEANFVFALPAARFRIFEHSDQGDLSLVERAAPAAGPFRDRIDLEFFPGATFENELARRFADKRTRIRALGMTEAGKAVAVPNDGECLGYVFVAVTDPEQSGFIAARPWFGGIVVCAALLTPTSSDAVPMMSAVRSAWTWLRRSAAHE
ncbi:MAG: hypothetical protein NVSMB64_01570 [Candidatus Velthaea sp.]